MVRPAVVFGGGKWVVAEMDMNRLGTWKRTWASGRARNMEKKY
jgi:hypothetical protein